MTTRIATESNSSLPGYIHSKDDVPPSYPLQILNRPQPPLDEEVHAASAPQPRRARWFQVSRFSTYGKLLVGFAVLALVAFVAAMIWFGVNKGKMNDGADLSLARNMVRPPTPPFVSDVFQPLVAPVNVFSLPFVANASNFEFFSNETSTVVLTASTLLSLPSSSEHFVRVFGDRTTQLNFVPSSDPTATDWTVKIDAFWKVLDGADQQHKKDWGSQQISSLVGGIYRDYGTGPYGFVVRTSGYDDFSYNSSGLPRYSVLLNPDLWWESSILYNITIAVPAQSFTEELEVYTENAGLVIFGDLSNTTFKTIDIIAPKAHVEAYGDLASPRENRVSSPTAFTLIPPPSQSSLPPTLTIQSLSVYAGQGVSGSFAVSSNATLLSRSDIYADFAFPSVSSTSEAQNLVLLTVRGMIYTNITSVSLSSPGNGPPPALLLDATTLMREVRYKGGILVSLPVFGFNGSFEMGTNLGRATAVYATTAYINNGLSCRSYGGSGVKKVKDRFTEQTAGKGRIRLNAGEGNVRLAVAPKELSVWTI